MKSLLLTAAVLLLCFVQSSAQIRLVRSGTKTIELGPKDDYTYAFNVHDVFEYKNKSFVLVSSMNIKLNFIPISIGGNFMDKSALMMKYAEAVSESQFNTGTLLLELDPEIRGKKGLKKSQLEIPKKLLENTYKYLGFLQDGKILNIYVGTANDKLNKAFVFCITYDLDSNTNFTTKIFETDKRKDPIAFFKSDEFKYAGLASIHGKGKPKMNYLITTIDNKPLNYGVNESLSELKKTTIQDFLVGKNGELLFNLTYEKTKNKERVAAIYSLDKDKGLQKIRIDGKPFHSNYILFLGAQDEIKTAYLSSNEEKYFTDMVIADVNVQQDMVTNRHSKSFIELKLNGETKVKSYKSSKKQQRKNKKREKRSQGGFHVTDVQVSADNTTYILMERISVVVRNDRSQDANGNQSNTQSRRYDYGPGKMILLNENNDFINISDLDYKRSFMNINPGKGLEFIAVNNQNMVVKSAQNFKQYDLSKDKIRMRFKGTTKAALKALFAGKYENFMRSKDKLYLIDVEHRTKLKFSMFSL